MKPIFREELNFLHIKGIDIPEGCWKDGSKIYLTPYSKTPLLKISIVDDNVIIKDDNRNKITDITMPIEDIVQIEKDRILEKEKQAIDFLNKFAKESQYVTTILAYSGGKDSDVLLEICKKSDVSFIANWANTSNESPETYLHIKNRIGSLRHNYMNPKEGYYQWIERKRYLIPTRLIRNCCSTYKEGQLTKFYDKNSKLIQITGVRRDESTKRKNYEKIMDYDFDINLRGKSSMPKKWISLAPIVEWTDLDIWCYIFLYNIEYNKQYNYGFERCGCLICPYQSDYTDLLIKHFYPKMWDRWENKILKNSFESLEVYRNFKYTFEEWINHKWKSGTSKEYEITRLKPTYERIKELADIKGITEDIAEKYFKNKCCKCGKDLNPNEVGINLKYYGRNMNIDKMVCKKCFCEENNLNSKEYNNLVINFRDSGCNLF